MSKPKETASITFFVLFRRTNIGSLSLFVNNEFLSHKTSVKNFFNFNEQVNKLIQASRAELKSVYNFKSLISEECKSRLSNALILDRLQCCDVVHGLCQTQTEAYRLQKVQNSCVRDRVT